MLDGEIVAVDDKGHPSFQALQHRGAHPTHAVVFYAFDVLHLDGEDLTRRPLSERRAHLPAVVKSSGVLVSQELPGTAAQVIEAVRHLGLEGVIAKYAQLKPLHVARCPFVDLPNSRLSRWGAGVTAEEMAEMQWLKPKLVAQIRFVEWTADGRLRHAGFLGLRDDKQPHSVRREG